MTLRAFRPVALAAGLALTACTAEEPPRIAGAAQDSGELAVKVSLGGETRRLQGLASPEVQAALGRPNFTRRDATAEIWQYYGAGCILDLFLYDESGVARVAFLQVRGPVAGQAPAGRCLRDLLERREASARL
ncbi:MAG: hypothetical protein HQL39_03945 [Alphaproteobacteria bacterium]|nr:hypothetical protein [Alphaproteobacteria bacterium]